MSYDKIQEIIRQFDTRELKLSEAYGDGGIDPLWPRLDRAAMNQVGSGGAAVSRYGIWANTVRDNIREAISLLDSQKQEDAMPLLIRAANSLSAFSEIQHLLDVEEK